VGGLEKKLAAMTYEQDLMVRRCFSGKHRDLPWPEIAREAIEEAELWSEDIANPATFWRKRVRLWVDEHRDSEKGAAVPRTEYVPLGKRSA
jgi:hypothetical protein